NPEAAVDPNARKLDVRAGGIGDDVHRVAVRAQHPAHLAHVHRGSAIGVERLGGDQQNRHRTTVGLSRTQITPFWRYHAPVLCSPASRQINGCHPSSALARSIRNARFWRNQSRRRRKIGGSAGEGFLANSTAAANAQAGQNGRNDNRHGWPSAVAVRSTRSRIATYSSSA